MQIAARCVLAAVLGLAAVARISRPRAARAALATFGVSGARSSWALWTVSCLLEAGLASAVALGSDAAALGAAALMVVYAIALIVALARGRGGAPCGCFGTRSRVSAAAVVRNVLLAGAFAALPAIPASSVGLSTDGWLAAGLVLALIAVSVLAVAVLALAREVGALRLRLAPERALEIPGEGPELGASTDLPERVAPKPRAQLALGIFTSEGCPLCRELAPAVRVFEQDPVVALGTFDEIRDADVWEMLDVPGSPYAVATDRAGIVRAKGTFNSFGQLESVLAAAERRIGDPALA